MHPSPKMIGHSSPGYLQVGHAPSKETRQIPHNSSMYPLLLPLLGRDDDKSQCQVQKPFHSSTVTFIFPSYVGFIQLDCIRISVDSGLCVFVFVFVFFFCNANLCLNFSMYSSYKLNL